MKRTGAIILYNLLLPIGLFVSLPGFLVKMVKRGNHGRDFLQRFGVYGKEAAKRLEGGCDFWIHAVSVGEVFVARKLIEEIRGRGEEVRMVLSTTTSTGYTQAKNLEGADLTAIYNPVDLPGVATRALERIRPKVLILVEAEVWPNLVVRSRGRGIPVILVNARLSPRSEARYRFFRPLVKFFFEELEAVLVQYREDVERWAAIGAVAERVRYVGSIKYDLEAGEEELGAVETFRRILDGIVPTEGRVVLLLGSTHPGEEKLLGRVYMELKKEFPGLFLVVVPRHVERAVEAVHDLSELGLAPLLRSGRREAASPAPEGGRDRCLVVDTTGELAGWYHLADFVVIGKSFAGEGGQNPVEAIVAGKPVFFGPRMSNFLQLASQLTENEAAVQVEEAEGLSRELAIHLRERERGEAMVARAREVLGVHAGAAKRTADFVLERLIDTGTGDGARC